MAERGHSKVGASGMYRWEECPASVRLTEGLHTTNVYAQLGTHAHEVAADILENPSKEAWHLMNETTELMDAVMVYVNLIYQETRKALVKGTEFPFDMSAYHPGLFGTCDQWAYFKKEKLLRVYDYKHGSGHFVKVEGNRQLLYYGLGALLQIPLPVLEVELVIVQPRCPRGGEVVHRWRFSAMDIMPTFFIELIAAAKRTEDPNAPMKVGAYCYFCAAINFCPAKVSECLEKAKEDFSVVTPEILASLAG